MERKTGLKRRGENCQDQHAKGGIHHHKESTRGFCQPQNISEEGVSTFIVPRRSFRKEPEFLHRQFLLAYSPVARQPCSCFFLVAFLVCMAKTPSERRKKHVYFLEHICAAAFHHLSFAKGEEAARGGSSFCKNLTNWINLTAPLIGNLH